MRSRLRGFDPSRRKRGSLESWNQAGIVVALLLRRPWSHLTERAATLFYVQREADGYGKADNSEDSSQNDDERRVRLRLDLGLTQLLIAVGIQIWGTSSIIAHGQGRVTNVEVSEAGLVH